MGDRGRLTTCLTIGFRVHPNHGNALRVTMNQIMSEIAASNMLSFLAKQLTSLPVVPVKYHPTMPAEVLEANYILS